MKKISRNIKDSIVIVVLYLITFLLMVLFLFFIGLGFRDIHKEENNQEQVYADDGSDVEYDWNKKDYYGLDGGPYKTKKGNFITIEGKKITFPIYADEYLEIENELIKNKDLDVSKIMYAINDYVVYGLGDLKGLDATLPYNIKPEDRKQRAMEKITSFKKFKHDTLYFEVYDECLNIIPAQIVYNDEDEFEYIQFGKIREPQLKCFK